MKPSYCKPALAAGNPLSRHFTAVYSKTYGPSLPTSRSASTARLVVEKSPKIAAPSTLAALPTPVLMRSLLVSAISSKPMLLRPSLAVLSFLTRPNRGFFTDVDRNPVLHSLLKSVFYKQFCAGETPKETKDTMRHLRFMGFRGTILTYAKETIFDAKTNMAHGLGIESETNTKSNYCSTIESWRKGALETVDLLGDGDQLALKLTGAGPRVTEAFAARQLPPQQMMDALEEISQKCKDRGIRLLLDAESQHFQWGIFLAGMELMRKFNRDGYATIFNTYQAYLKSTPDTLARHLEMANREGFTHGLKLVRGAYISSDDRSLIHDTKHDTDNAYNSIAQGALKRQIGEYGAPGGKPFPSLNLFLASHNKYSVVTAHKLHHQRLKDGLPTVPVGFAQLQGMSDEVSFSLLQLKEEGQGQDPSPQVWKCSTWGTMGECVAYLLRRAVENRDAVSRTVDEYSALKAEVGRRLRSRFSRSRQHVSQR
ncbi:proline oxidase [Colletotrichum incanum]|nr:proline oxidase [Colletotrichum incanum]